MLRKTFILTILFFAVQASASVWDASPGAVWNDQWEQKYSNWIAAEVGPTFFKDLGNPFKNVRLDCADAHYALRAYFARMNGLPFAVNKGSLTNKTTRFDHISNANNRLAAFMEFLAASYGTESLSHVDTFPVNIYDIKPGDLFMYKVYLSGEYTRHTYIIKNINIDGTFDVMYSTQARFKDNLPLNRQKTYMFKKAPINTGNDKNYWGFRRAKLPHEATIHQNNLSPEYFNQYQMASQMDALSFFRAIKKIYQTIDESPQMIVNRNFNTVCSALNDRVGIVASGAQYSQKIGRCMNFQEYDSHSTPSRDKGIMSDYSNFAFDLNEIVSQGNQNKVQNLLLSNAALIFGSKALTQNQKNQLAQSCPINAGTGKHTVDLGTFKRQLFGGEISYNPNDNIYYRWGFFVGNKTSCKEFYGYPE